MTTLTEQDHIAAGEYVLGLLDPAGRAIVAARISTDAVFADEVDAWQDRLLPLLTHQDLAPPPHIWSAISASLPAPTVQDNGVRSLRVWQVATAVATSTAAVLAVMLMQQPRSSMPVAPAPPLVAALGSENSTASMTARYDPASGQILLTPVTVETGQLYPELWIIPSDGTPRSLGIIRADRPMEMIVDADHKAMMHEGATLAITPERESGAPGGKPTGAILASGKIVII